MRHVASALAILILASAYATALDPLREDLGPLGEAEEDLLRATLGRVHALRAPLLVRPAFTLPHGSFSAEIETRAGITVDSLWLRRGTTECPLARTLTGAGPSEAWPDLPHLDVLRFRLDLGACPPGLYDLHLRSKSGIADVEERQVRAVRVMEPARWLALAAGVAHPRFVVIADPQIGDPRAITHAAQEDPAGIPAAIDGLVGDGGATTAGRWKAVRTALAEARAMDPDFVLITGDLGFGQLVPGSYAAEYEEIWRVLAAADVPIFAAPGNHDGYVSNGQDGVAYWRAYLGPTYTFAPAVPRTRVLVMNTYDWSDLDRVGVSYGVSAWGGQVRDEQLAWMENALDATPPFTRVIAIAHHSPSWRQDPWEPLAEGIPVAEQVERGARTYTTTDQGWIGENRLEVRDLLRAHGVEMHFAGHTHHDRIARDDGHGRIVGTQQTLRAMPDGFDPRMLHYWDRDDTLLEGHTQAALASLLRDTKGPLYVDTTTAMSDTEQYWGYRPVEIRYDAQGRIDLAKLGHPLTQAELDELALHPERYNVDHAELGLFSKPLRLNLGAPWTTVPAPD